MKLIFWKANDKSHPKVQFLSILAKYFKRYGNINKCNLTTSWRGFLPNMAISRDSG